MIQFDKHSFFQMGWFNHPNSYMIPTIYTVKAFSGDVWGSNTYLVAPGSSLTLPKLFQPQVEAVLTKAVADSAWILWTEGRALLRRPKRFKAATDRKDVLDLKRLGFYQQKSSGNKQ